MIRVRIETEAGRSLFDGCWPIEEFTQDTARGVVDEVSAAAPDVPLVVIITDPSGESDGWIGTFYPEVSS